MASFLSLSLSFLLLFHGCLALQPFQQTNKCQFQNIDALEPNEVAKAEGGYSVFFDSGDQQFRCAGAEVIRHHIQPQGLFLPSYINAPLVVYIVQGSGYQGVMLPGCPETFESPQQSGEFQDRHQKIHRFEQGDVIVIPTGAAHWMYNDGQQELVALVFIDNTNQANQLDQFHRRFFLAGNPNEQQQQQLQQQPQRREILRRQKRMTSSEEGFSNIFQGFDLNMLSEVFMVDPETAQKLQGLDDTRGHIVMVERGLQVIKPPIRSRQQGGRSNGLEETVCSARISMNINDVSRADVFNPLGGWSSTLSSIKLPILEMVKLSVKKGVLNKNAVMSPTWITNAHSIMYVTQGYMKMQIINNEGRAVYDGEIREGQVVVMPQNFAIGKQAGPEGCQWISFRTNDNAIVNNLAGRMSFIKGMPVDVIMNMYQLSMEQAMRLKNNQNELMVFSPK